MFPLSGSSFFVCWLARTPTNQKQKTHHPLAPSPSYPLHILHRNHQPPTKPTKQNSAKALAPRASAAGLRAVTSAGLYPGVSNVMASHLVAANGAGGVAPPVLDLLRYSYYTAGSGGAGRTILETSFLLLGERAAAWRDGERFELPAMSNRREVDFGPGECRVLCLFVYLLYVCERTGAHLGVLRIGPSQNGTATAAERRSDEETGQI